MMIDGKKIEWQGLGLLPYGKAASLQDDLRRRRISGEICDRMLLLEHAPVITMGRKDCGADIISPPDVLCSEGIEVVKTDRGGRATYHGPGQLIGYFICSLSGLGIGIRDFVLAAEDICVRTLADLGVEASRDEAHPGLWVKGNKIVAVGLNVSRGVTRHGIAMNVSCDLGAYRHIVACGISDRGVTSVERELGSAPRMEDVSERFVAHAGAVLRRRMSRLAAT